jgi:adenylate cyclase
MRRRSSILGAVTSVEPEYGDSAHWSADGQPAYGDFEFERRFLVGELPEVLRDAPALIVQSYYLSSDGYAIRVRCQAQGTDAPMSADTDPSSVLTENRDKFDFAAITVKGPTAGGTRYEAEREIDPQIAAELVARGGSRIVKVRYSAWLGADGWVIDVFGGENYPLIVAECERSGPVTDLAIPKFCISELTDDARFSNEHLAVAPYSQWHEDYQRELAETGARFREDFGVNQAL